jgi:hypothetical protein
MIAELQNFEIHVSESGKESYDARTGAHDDLVVSLGLACWFGSQESMAPIQLWGG